MIPKILKAPVSVAQYLVTAAVNTGVSGATALASLVRPGSDAPSKPSSTPGPSAPTAPRVSTEPITQPPAPAPTPTPGATTTMADPAPATLVEPAAKKAPAKKAAKKAPAKKAAAKAPAKKAPAKKKPAAVLDEPVAPSDDDPVVYSTGPDSPRTAVE